MSGLNINVGDLVTEETGVADVQLRWDFELATARALFRTDGTRIFFNYAANPIFETMDLARFYTDANVQLKDAALAYAASQANVGIPAITNTAEWLAAFVSQIEIKLNEIHARCMTLDMHSGTSNTLVSVGEYWALGETMAAPLLLDRELDALVDGFAPVQLLLNDVLYFDLTVLFEFIHQQIYRVNLRLVAPITPIPYPVAQLTHVRYGTLVDMHTYIAPFESDTSFALTIGSVSVVVDFELDSATLISQLKLAFNLEVTILGNYIIIYSVEPFTVSSSPFPAGQQLVGKGYLRYALTSANAVTTVPPLWLNKGGTRFLAPNSAEYTTDSKWVLSQPDYFTAVDERGHDSSAAYAALGFSRLRTIPAAAFLDFYHCLNPEFTETPNKIAMTYAVLPDESGPITVSIVVNLVSSNYYFNYTGDAAGLIDAFSLDPYISVTSDSVILVLTPHTMTAGPSNDYPLTFLSGYFVEAVYVAMSPLPVTTFTLETPVEFLGAQVAGTYTPQGLADALTQNGFYVVVQNGFLKIENVRPFATGVFAEAGFNESRTAELVLPRLTLL
jgi:hypothetical protein